MGPKTNSYQSIFYMDNKWVFNEQCIIIVIVISQVWLYALKGNTKFWYGVMNLVQINILEACMWSYNI